MIYLIASLPTDEPSGSRVFLRICDVLSKAHQDGSYLRTGGIALREEFTVGAVDDPLAGCPLHRILGISADPIRIPPESSMY